MWKGMFRALQGFCCPIVVEKNEKHGSKIQGCADALGIMPIEESKVTTAAGEQLAKTGVLNPCGSLTRSLKCS